MELLGAFESIGDNCEFGLIQKNHGIDEGSLLKWARIIDVNHLIDFLNNDFKDLYLYENLAPKWDDMVVDAKYGFWFHSEMRSQSVNKQRNWLNGDEDARRVIYDEEYRKRRHLVDKLRVTIEKDAKIFIYKMNEGVDERDVKRLHAALRRHGDCHLLYVKQAQNEDEPLTVENVDEGLWVASIRRFAPYWPVSDYLPGAWEDVCARAYPLIRGT